MGTDMKIAFLAAMIFYSLGPVSAYADSKLYLTLNSAKEKFGACNMDFILTNNYAKELTKIALNAVFVDKDGDLIENRLLVFERTKMGKPSTANYVQFFKMNCNEIAGIRSYSIAPGTLAEGNYVWPNDPWYEKIENALNACSKVETFDISSLNSLDAVCP
ncbi:hypothetical protein V6R98_14520 [Agrobacterium sp. CCNWLW71]|uniref:hypothetical protein n=1 Tax=unclassified Agrobacterium TaxID=2632611 RepID=UPI002FF1C16C